VSVCDIVGRAGAGPPDVILLQPNGTPGKKPPTPSVKVRMGQKARQADEANRY